ncbi:hypothetical protein CL617_02340 [archaeon]|nr:hypothetical protein [archaeon]|tara:strand:+ start:13535 stop:14152 length:618 start_codon:yes stop_codon:yes gene_type:complete
MDRIIKLLIVSELFLFTGFSLIDPFLAVFVKEDLVNGSLIAAGFATTLFLVIKSVVQLPFSKYIDSHRDKLRFLIIGSLIVSTVPFIYIFATRIEHIYIAQIIRGVGAGLAVPTWLGLFTTHIDKGKESFEWSIYSTSLGMGMAVSGLVGATIASFLGFKITFIIVGILALIGSSILFKLEVQEHKKKGKEVGDIMIKRHKMHHP